MSATPLAALHRRLGGKLHEYAGSLLPLTFPAGVKQEHLHTREAAAFFDVSHMGQVHISGPNRDALVRRMFAADLTEREENTAALTLMLNERGGIEDDSIVTRHTGYYHAVVNGACKDKDLGRIRKEAAALGDVDVQLMGDVALVAIQGPRAVDVLAPAVDGADIRALPFMSAAPDVSVAGVAGCRVHRCGYTGEDGFEVSMPAAHAEAIMDSLINAEPGLLMPAGLGARDSLRLEAGLCLYGQDMRDDVDPFTAALVWTLAKNHSAYIGADAVAALRESRPPRRRVGIRVGVGIARHGAPVIGPDGSEVGEITSGGFSPVLEAGVAMAIVDTALAKKGTELSASVRGKAIPCTVAPLPFVPHNYAK